MSDHASKAYVMSLHRPFAQSKQAVTGFYTGATFSSQTYVNKNIFLIGIVVSACSKEQAPF